MCVLLCLCCMKYTYKIICILRWKIFGFESVEWYFFVNISLIKTSVITFLMVDVDISMELLFVLFRKIFS